MPISVISCLKILTFVFQSFKFARLPKMCSNWTYVNEIENTKYQAIWNNFYVLFVLLRVSALSGLYNTEYLNRLRLRLWSLSDPFRQIPSNRPVVCDLWLSRFCMMSRAYQNYHKCKVIFLSFSVSLFFFCSFSCWVISSPDFSIENLTAMWLLKSSCNRQKTETAGHFWMWVKNLLSLISSVCRI